MCAERKQRVPKSIDKPNDQIRVQLVRVRHVVERVASQAEQGEADSYMMVSSLLEAAEALLEGVIDDRTVGALDVLSDLLSAEMDDPAPPALPAIRQVMAA
jgi:hypothetical protein